ncbi:hypothetical protein [Actinoallomurus soli]|uniref:hypothetical protein n=1 Tax=Actinoallomurus soli TaxID=2952535 RepID=UPI002092EFC3|nr:hypothetical protein [Actinoallomurus soli]MCO5974099.1 hypothetical protein [Actinoallomurus soli]
MSERDHHPFRGPAGAWAQRAWDWARRSSRRRTPSVHMSGVDDSAVARVPVSDDDFAAYAVAPVCFDTEPSGGCRHHDHEIDECPGGGPARHGNDGQSRSVNGGLR